MYRLIGNIRLRQLRLKPNSCTGRSIFRKQLDVCIPNGFADEDEEKETFGSQKYV